VALAATACGPAAAATVTASPALVPAYATSRPDQVVRCDAATPVRLSVVPGRGERVAVDGLAARSRPFAAQAPLAPGQAFAYTVRTARTTVTHHVRCIPADFPRWTSSRPGVPTSRFFVVTPTADSPTAPGVEVFDTHGAPLWWMAGKALNGSVDGGNLVWGVPSAAGSTVFESHRLDGRLVHRWQPVGGLGDSHEFRRLPNGDALLLVQIPKRHVDLSKYATGANAADATVEDLEIQEITPAGKRVWSWRASDHIAPAETGRWYKSLQVVSGTDADPMYDLYHTNAYAPDGKGLLISMRHTDAIYRIDRATGRIDWKLGGTKTAQSLRIVGDPDAAVDFGGQHDVNVLPDGTVTLYDNGTDRGRPPRALRFRIDTKRRTATLVEKVADAKTVPRSPYTGSAIRLPGGNWAMSFGGTPYIEELTARGGLAFRLTFPTTFSYRVFPVLAGSPVTAERLRAGMDAMAPRRTAHAKLVAR